MPRLVTGSTALGMNPLDHGQTLGGLLALLGIDRCMPLLHGGQGCSAFAKALLTRHFREPVPVQTTALTETSTVLGPTDSLITALETIDTRHHPDVIGVLTTGVPEVCGEDLPSALHTWVQTAARQSGPTAAPLVVAVSTPDFAGGLSAGWSTTLSALVEAGVAEGLGFPTHPDPDVPRVALLAGCSLTAADLDDLDDLLRGFGTAPLLVPDAARGLDGHLGPGWSPLTSGGTPRSQLRELAGAGAALAVGASATQAAATLAALTGAAGVTHPHLGGLAATDALVSDLMALTSREPSARLRHQRRRLTDALLDSHFVLGDARVAVAGEPEFVAAVSTVLAEAGATLAAVVTPHADAVLDQVPAEEVVLGDLSDLEARAAEGGATLVVASSHARDLAARVGAEHLVMGFPVYDELGAQTRGFTGYRGGVSLLFAAANLLLNRERRSVPRPCLPTTRLPSPAAPSASATP